jgi:hypothetical protein
MILERAWDAEDGISRHLASSDGIERQSLGALFSQFSSRISTGSGGRPRQDSNLRSRLRRPLLSPLSYGGPGT